MIQQLVIRNFQRHRKLRIPLDPHVTTIVGPSDSGKSSIIRSLRWVILNEPRGKSFVKAGTDRASVSISVDKHRITRRRGFLQGNSYKLDGKIFAAFGNGIPDEISGILRLDEINFQGQHDPPFWFSLSPPEVSRRLNQIVDLSLIDSTLANLSKEVRRAKVEKGIIEERLKEARGERKELRQVRGADSDLSHLEGMELILTELGRRVEDLGILLSSAQGNHQFLERTKPKLKEMTQEIQEVDVGTSEGKKARQKYEDVKSLLTDIQEGVERIILLRRELVETEKEFTEEIGEVCPLCHQSIHR